MPEKHHIYVIRKRLPWQKIEKALKYRREYNTQKAVELESPCGLAGGPIYYRIYSTWSSKLGLSSIHICRHLDGICISGSLNVDVDNNLAEKAYSTLEAL